MAVHVSTPLWNRDFRYPYDPNARECHDDRDDRDGRDGDHDDDRAMGTIR